MASQSPFCRVLHAHSMKCMSREERNDQSNQLGKINPFFGIIVINATSMELNKGR